MANTTLSTDVLVIGSGIAGLITALKCAEFASVLIITKKQLSESNTRYAQGGVAVALGNNDSPEKHFKDTMTAGCQHNNPKIVSILTQEGPHYLNKLINSGLSFHKENHLLDFAQEAAHSVPRVLHNKDKTGETIITYLIEKIKSHKNITLLEDCFVFKLLIQDSTCHGCYAIHNHNLVQISSKTTCLSTGGIGQLFKHTSNPSIATGDGLFLGYEAGCKLIDLEFMQFHPTSFCTDPKLNTYFLISESIRGAGACLINQLGDDFMNTYHPKGSLAPRDIVSRGIYDQLHQGNNVYLDCRNITKNNPNDFPAISDVISQAGLSLKSDLIPITPTAHYMMGGLLTNEHSQTTIKQLYANGEVACNGCHGANRLASNSLLDGIVFGNRAALHIQRIIKSLHLPRTPLHETNITLPKPVQDNKTITKIHSLLWSHCGINRSPEILSNALSKLKKIITNLPQDFSYSPEYHHAILAEKIITSAYTREESLGSHYINPSQLLTKDYWITQSKNQGLVRYESFPSISSS
jgi:L-aspartate oxidase